MLNIFNTSTGKKEKFKSIKKDKINLYVCGVTVYDLCHIGHGRTFVFFDMLVRYLRHVGFQVTYIRNITDIDDKIILKSIEKQVDINVFTDSMIRNMKDDFNALGILSPNEEPRVTDHINDIINIIKKLIFKKHAYINKNGDVVFSVNCDKTYGSLSRQSLNSLNPGSRVPVDSTKRNPLDFFLWKKSNCEQFSWESPWGQGRPGWHIECSAISSVFFKDCVDIHGGGSDLLFPHHENEKSQSFCLHENMKINFWMHTGMVIMKNKKMSKSLGNVYFLRDILLEYNYEVVRYFFLSTHYRHPIYFSKKSINQAQCSLEYLYESLYNTNAISNTDEGIEFEKKFYYAMNDDFNTPQVFLIFSKLARKINYLKKIDILKSNKLAFRLQSLLNILGFLLQDIEEFFKNKNKLNKKMIEKIEILVQKRDLARRCKMWKEADLLREKLKSLNVFLEDLPNNKTIWKIK
ncbi:MAG: cysteine--tRNA ligase [Buchnera aphidicola (Pentalonia nigronervosa)]|jgi:cysteinyl-tRNA synthetase|uniref:Cysteine--tRNA ligase n=1 Tax=Buchnera aphidicola (Pentalonia nigronervosa) TaxID=1309793 RepID=A0A7H1AYW3_9GAMM|nr:MAG: cysteine--tRNA ligase [Buchnera aphidicola (Pentalonia nigronervosa)]